MARSKLWCIVGAGVSVRRRRPGQQSCPSRCLMFESLEERRMLATITVTSRADNLIADGQVTLREAIRAAELNISVDGSVAGSAVQSDAIQFAANLSGAVNLSVTGDTALGPTALAITSPITIQGNSSGITVQREATGPEMRLFRVTTTGNLTLESIMLTGGVARGADGTAGTPNGVDGRGGAVFVDQQGTLNITSSTLYANHAIGGNGASGGRGGSGLGGAVYSDGGTVTIVDATLSGNTAESGSGATVPSSLGGGLYSRNGSLAIYNSTITSNTSTTGRGVYVVGQAAAATAELYSSIIASADLLLVGFDFLAASEADGAVEVGGASNLIRRQNDFPEITVASDDPLLGVLENNGGPTWTHALAVNSPAVNRGDNPLNLMADQRGPLFARVAAGVADIGAYERQTTGGPALPGDYNGNSVVDAADYVVWRNTQGTSVASYSGADGNGDGQIDSLDYELWRANFGRVPATAAVADSGGEQLVTAADERNTPPAPTLLLAPAMATSEVVFVPVFVSEPSVRAASAVKTADFLPALGRDQLELTLIEALDAVERSSQDAADELPRIVGERDDACDAGAIDELLADWPAAF